MLRTQCVATIGQMVVRGRLAELFCLLELAALEAPEFHFLLKLRKT